MIFAYLTLASGAYLCVGAFLMDCPDFKSDIILRAIPGLIGIGNMIAGANMAGMLT